MKHHIITVGLLAMMPVSCSVHEMDISKSDLQTTDVFYAQFEAPNDESATKVYATDDLYIRWNADDRITIFNKYTYNQEYRFNGETGDNSGSFKRVDNGDFVTGNALDNIYSIYPYRESTRISDTAVMTVTLPVEQKYAENTFGLGSNTMISVTTDNQLMFKNAGGYLMLKLYGNDVLVRSISLKGNKGEKIAGKATVTMPVGGVPVIEMENDAEEEITLLCDTPVKIGSTAETATTFWLVVPPTVFEKGFTLTVKDNNNGVFVKTTTKSFEICRNNLARMSALNVIPEPSDDAIVFADLELKKCLITKFDSNGDGELSFKEAAEVTSLQNVFGEEKAFTSFDEFQFFIGVNTIPEACFSGWTRLNSIVLPNSIYDIGMSAFMNCVRLGEIRIPALTVRIRDNAFSGCSALSSMVFPASVTYIPRSVCSDCVKLEEVQIQGDVTIIGERAFSGCTKLLNISIPSSLRYINDYAFSNCINLSKIDLPETMSIIYNGAFSGCTSLKSIVCPSGINEIRPNTFENCTSLAEVSLPTSITQINGRAFKSCKSLVSVTIPDRVSSIWFEAFSDCSKLKQVQLPDQLSVIASWAFKNCSDLSQIQLPNNLRYIGVEAFSNCSSLPSINLPNGLLKIGQAAFRGCYTLKMINIPNTVNDINYGAKNDPEALPIIGGTSSEDGMCFYGCSSLESVTLSETLTEIPYCCFYSCGSLSEINNVNNIITIGARAFNNCSILASFQFSDILDNIGDQAFYGSGLKSVPIYNDVSYGTGVFKYCYNLESIEIEEGVVTIPDSVFSNCSHLTEVQIPGSVSEIGPAAFYGCSDLSRIVIDSIFPPKGNPRMFDNTNDATIYVPAESVDAYTAAQYWSTYAERIVAFGGVRIPDAVDLGVSVK